MSFKQIGIPARKVIAEAELRVSRAPSTAANEGGRLTGEETISPPTLYADAPAPSGSNGKGRGTKPRQLTEGKPSPAPKGKPALRLVISNRGEPTHAAHEGAYTPVSRRVGSPILLVVGGREHHTRSG